MEAVCFAEILAFYQATQCHIRENFKRHMNELPNWEHIRGNDIANLPSLYPYSAVPKLFQFLQSLGANL
jgi:hypothetical protein